MDSRQFAKLSRPTGQEGSIPSPSATWRRRGSLEDNLIADLLDILVPSSIALAVVLTTAALVWRALVYG